jgi:hypothetical protein
MRISPIWIVGLLNDFLNSSTNRAIDNKQVFASKLITNLAAMLRK